MKKRKNSVVSMMLAVLMSFSGCSMAKEIISDIKKFTNNARRIDDNSNERSIEDDNNTSISDILLSDNNTLGDVVGDNIVVENTDITSPVITNSYDRVNEINSYGYINNVTILSNYCEDYIGDLKIDKFQKVYVLYEGNDYDYVVEESGRYGFVKKEDITLLENEYIEVDISDQKLYYYIDNCLKLETDVITGKENKYDTRIGSFEIYEKTKGRYLAGDDYRVWVDYWMRFDNGIGLHDATWRRGKFGGNIYKTNGSHGCVNMSSEDAMYIYDNAKLKTKVLVHK